MRPSRGMGAIRKSKMPTASNKTDTPDTYAAGDWIKDAINPKNKGALKRSLGVKKSQPIPMPKLAAAAKMPGKLGQRARLAKTLRKFK
jgi:hypothetical protein